MSRLAVAGLISCLLCSPSWQAAAQEPATVPDERPEDPTTAGPADDAEHPAHEELRALRQSVVQAVKDNDLDALVAHLHPEVVVVWQNAEISRGHAGVREYYRRMMEGPDRIVERVTIEAAPRELTVLHGDDTGVSFGDANAQFELRQGMNVDLDGPWSAIVVREDGRWLIASFHASVDAFDNPFVATMQRAMYWAAGIAFVLGLAVGVVATLFVRRRRTPEAQA